MNTINREHFEAWLFSQPDDRQFDYTEGQPYHITGCLICNFFREQTNLKQFGVSGSHVGFRTSYSSPYFSFDKWLQDLLFRLASPKCFNAKRAKEIYLSLFPNAIVGNTPPEAIVSKVESDSIAQESKTILATS